MREEKILVDEIETYYKVGGEGRELLILHGWGGCSDSWKRAIEILERKFKVVCPDLPGFGKTKFPDKVFNLEEFAKWLFEFTKNLKMKKIYLLGHSFGGRIAIKFSILYPEKIEKLILVDSAGIKTKKNLKVKIAFFLAKIGNAIFSKKPLERFKFAISDIFYKIFSIRDYAKVKGKMKKTMQKILEEDLLGQLEKIKIPTLIIWGKEDKIVPLKYGILFKEKIKNSKIKILPGVGHSPHLEAPETLCEILISNLP